MAINQVIYQGDVLVDLTQDTVTPETLLEGVTAHAQNGEIITGTACIGSEVNLQDKTVTANGSVTADEGYTGLGTVTVNVPDPDLIDIAAGEITENGEYVIETPEGYDGIGKVTATIAVPTPTHEVYAGEYEELGGLINFTIDGVTYQAENGMTWTDWWGSEYDTTGVFNEFNEPPYNGSGQTVYAPSGKFLFEEPGHPYSDWNTPAAVLDNETIIADHDYYSQVGSFN